MVHVDRIATAVMAVSLLMATASSAAEPPPPRGPDLPPGVGIGAPPPGTAPIPRGAPPPPPGPGDGDTRVMDDGRIHAVISKEMEPTLAAMFPEGPEANLPGGAVIDGVQIGREQVDVKVKLADGTFATWRLRARIGQAPAGQSRKFIIERGADETPQPELDAAITRLVLAREPAFTWQEVRAKPTMAAVNPEIPKLLARVDELVARGKMRDAGLKMTALIGQYRREQMELLPTWDVAVRLQRVGRPDDALVFYDWILKLHRERRSLGPMPRQAWQRYAGALHARGKTEEARAAIADCQKANRGTPSDCGLGQMAEVSALKGDLSTATALLDEALTKPGPGDEALVLDRISLARRQGQTENALKWAKVAAEKWPKSNDAVASLASAELLSGASEAGLRRWLALAETAPEYPGAVAAMADGIGSMRRAELEQGADRAALDDLLRELSGAATKGNQLAAFGVAMGQYHRGDLEAAFGGLTRLLTSRPKDPRVLSGLALSAHWLGHHEAARRHADNAVELTPGDPAVHLCRSVVRRPADLPGAAKDLGRHIDLRVAAGIDEKSQEIQDLKADLASLTAGRLPADRLRPQADRTLFGRGGMPAWWIVLLALLGLAGGALVVLRSRRASRTDD